LNGYTAGFEIEASESQFATPARTAKVADMESIYAAIKAVN
jgi:hypothetical protein